MVVKLTASPGHWAQAYPEFYNGGWITGVDQEFSKNEAEPRSLGDGRLPLVSRGKAQVGSLGTKPPEAEAKY